MSEKAPPFKKPRKPKGPPLSDPGLKAPKPFSPVLMFGLIAIPLVMALVVDFTQKPAPESPIVVQIQPVEAPAQVRPVYDGERRFADTGEGGGRGLAPCGFQDFIGWKPDQVMVDKLKEAEKLFRVLAPGAPMTMDFNANRVNLELNANGIIRRVWCG